MDFLTSLCICVSCDLILRSIRSPQYLGPFLGRPFDLLNLKIDFFTCLCICATRDQFLRSICSLLYLLPFFWKQFRAFLYKKWLIIHMQRSNHCQELFQLKKKNYIISSWSVYSISAVRKNMWLSGQIQKLVFAWLQTACTLRNRVDSIHDYAKDVYMATVKDITF